jgi:hypothetical protein
MKKFPLGDAIRHGYRFGFGRFVDLLRVMWLPAALAALCSYFSSDQLTVFAQALRTHDFSRLTMPWPVLILLTLAAFLLGTMQITAAYQLALGKIEARRRWFYFPLLERALWQVVGAFLALVLTLGALMISFALAVLLVGILFNLGFHAAHMSDAAIKAVSAGDAALAFTVGYCGFIFCAVRFGFLLFPATVAEEKNGLFRAWTLSHRNFWRMLVTSLAAVAPVLLAECVLLVSLGLFKLPPPGATPAQVQAMQNAAEAAANARMHEQWYLFYPALALVMLLTYGILAGSQAFAYRALADDSERPIS